MKTVYIDGHVGTTGLRIRDWLSKRSDIQMAMLDEAVRKDPAARKQAVLDSDVSILCLPDEAAIEVAEWVKAAGSDTILIDGVINTTEPIPDSHIQIHLIKHDTLYTIYLLHPLTC